MKKEKKESLNAKYSFFSVPYVSYENMVNAIPMISYVEKKVSRN